MIAGGNMPVKSAAGYSDAFPCYWSTESQ